MAADTASKPLPPSPLPEALLPTLWPLTRLGDGLQALATAAGLRAEPVTALALPDAVATDAAELARWLDWAARQLGLQAEPVHSPWADVPALLRQAAPALLQLAGPQGPCFVLLLGRRGRQLRLLGPDLRPCRVPLQALCDALRAPAEAPLRADVDQLLASAQVPAARRVRASQALLGQRLGSAPLPGTWLLRQPAHAGLWPQLARARVPRRLLAMLALFALLYGLEITGWRLIGQAALEGRFDAGWLVAWALLLLSLVPLRLWSSSLNLGIALDAALALRQRLLAGALRIDLDRLRHQGSGQLLARVIESQALESAGLAGALGLLVALLELGCAAWVLAQGAAPAWHGLLLGLWLAGLLVLAARHHRQLRRWTAQRLDMTDGLVERLVGHRTRLAQEPPARRAAEEDQELGHYLRASQALDRRVLPVAAAAPAGWILLALLALAPALAAGTGWGGGAGSAGPAALAISLGGVLLAHRALAGVSAGLAALARAAVAWQQVAPLFQAGAGTAARAPFLPAAPAALVALAGPSGQGCHVSWPSPTAGMPGGDRDGADTAPLLLDAQALAFGYPGGAAPVLRAASLQLGPRARVLLAGPSGSGKSTLAALLVGLRRPSAGLLLLGGLDRATLGDDWHRRATEAPQFHDNHLFTGTLAFNLLMGRDWPPSPAQLAEAQALCDELGLGPLLQRMPAGLQQHVGETGWQLSHGERSRIFLARALLQRAPLTVLDESFAALDPHTLHRCLTSALQRAQALVVIAHP